LGLYQVVVRTGVKRKGPAAKEKIMKRFFAFFTAIAAVMALSAWAAGEIPESVKTLIHQRCAGCHKGAFAPKGLKLDPAHIAAILDAPSKEVPSLKIIDTKAPGSSYLLKKIRRESDIAGKGMPPPKALTAEELQVIETWIAGLK
jgi:mono/diheme cytochrome c family protein